MAQKTSNVQIQKSKKRGCLEGQHCCGSSFVSFKHSFDGRLSNCIKSWLYNYLDQGLTPSQVLARNKQEIIDVTMKGNVFFGKQPISLDVLTEK